MIAFVSVNIDPFLIKFPANWGFEGIRWYGVFYVISFFVLQFYLRRGVRKNLIDLDIQQSDLLLFYFACGAVIGGRLGHCVFYNFSEFICDPFVVFRVWNGGMSSHGGFIGAILGMGYFSWRYRCQFLRITDLFSAIVPLCLLLGRIGNFINSELVGRITDVPWGMIFERYDFNVRHPSQLYEAFFEGFLLFIILQIFAGRFRNQPGKLSCLFLILYSIARIICECFREPDAPLILDITRGQFYTIFLLLLGIVAWIVFQKRYRANKLK